MVYLGSFVISLQTFREFFSLNLDDYVESLRPQLTKSNPRLTLKAYFEKIDFLQREMERIRSKLVDVLWLHAFEINCKDLKRHLLSNAKSMQRLLLRKVNSDMSSHCKSMVTRFGEFYDVLNTWPKNIEAFDKLKQFLEAFESTHSDAVAAVAIIEDHLTGLEQRKYDVLQHDYNLYFKSRRWPYLLGEAKNRVNESMPKFQKRFENELGMQKRVFLEEIERLRVDFIGSMQKVLDSGEKLRRYAMKSVCWRIV